MIITIHTDGSATPNPGSGGYGAILKQGDYIKEISGSFRLTTNQRMELYAVISALRCLKQKNLTLEIYSDSKYVVDSIGKGWVDNWEKQNFKDRKNSDLWKEFLELRKGYNIQMIWVKGHASNEGNNRCDILATTASSKANKENWEIDEWYEKQKF